MGAVRAAWSDQTADTFDGIGHEDKLTLAEAFGVLLRCSWRIGEPAAGALDALNEALVVEVALMHQELIGMLCLHAVRGESFRRKMLEVCRDDNVGAAHDGSRENVPVSWIRQDNRLDEWLVSADKCVRNRLIHERSRAGKSLGCCLRIVLEDIGDPFLVDVVAPSCPIDVGVRSLDEEIANGCRIEHAGVEERSETRHLIPHVEFLTDLGELFLGLFSRGGGFLTIGEKILQPHAAMRADLAMGDLSLVEQLHEERS